MFFLSCFLRQLAYCLFFFSLWPISLFAQSDLSVGRVVFSSGSFQAIGEKNNVKRHLQRGSEFYTGDALVTGDHSNAQVRFVDGAIMALYPNTQIKVDNYVYKDNAKTDKSVLTVVKGGFRALTGLIAKNNPENYEVKTPVSVIGVRGTNYSLLLDENNKLYAGAWKGDISLKNDTGITYLGEHHDYQFAFVDHQHAVPVKLLNPPSQLMNDCQQLGVMSGKK